MNLFYRKYGDTGKAVIILHGMLGMSDNWVHFAKRLAEKSYRVFLPDVRNHGNSPHSKHFSYSLSARDLYEFAESQKISEAIVIGHSMGGKIAMQYANDYPSKVQQLVVLDIAPRKYTPDEYKTGRRINHPVLLGMLAETDLQQFNSRKEITDYFEKFPQAAPMKFFLQKNIRQLKNGNFEFKFNPKNILNNLEAVTEKPVFSKKKFKKPTLFIKGECSDYLIENDFDEIKRLYPNVKIEILKGAGHMLHAEKPRELFKVILTFLA